MATEDILETMLAATAGVKTFLAKTGRAWTGEEADDPKDFIHQAGLPKPAARGIHTREELEGYRPYLLLYETSYRVANMSTTGWRAGGEAIVEFFRDVPSAYLDDLAGSYFTFRTALKTILEDLAEASQTTAGYLPITAYAIHGDGPWRVPPEDEPEQGTYEWAAVSIQFGEQT